MTTRVIGKRDVAGCLGSAYSQAMHVYYRGRQAGVDTRDAAWPAALGYVVRQRDYWRDEGRRVADEVAADDAALELRLRKMIDFAVANDPVPETWTVVAVEEPLPDAGNARPDLVVRDDMGQLVVVDHKLKVSVFRPSDKKRDEKTRAWRIEFLKGDWRDSDQMFHYAQYVGQAYKGDVTHFVINLAEIEPSPRLSWLAFYVLPDALRVWVETQSAAWYVMDLQKRGVLQPWRASQHADQFGPCEFMRKCFDPVETHDTEYTTRRRT